MSLHGDMNSLKPAGTADDYITRWKQASQAQEDILSDALAKKLELEARTLELEARVKALEYENWTIRKMLEKSRTDSHLEDIVKQELQTRIDILASEHDSFKNENPLIVCLLDGDGCIFEKHLIQQGVDGGFTAAQRLSAGINNYLRRSEQRIPPGARIIITIYLSMIGVESALIGNGVCTMDQFSNFFSGFGNAHPLISVVDVGPGKEAADNKLREALDLYIRLPQTFKLFFGGGHDNGYHGSLAATSTIGHKGKLVILQSYTQLGREIGMLRLPVLDIPDLFMAEKLERRPLIKKILSHGTSAPAYPSPQPTPSKQKKKDQNSSKPSKAARRKSKSEPPALQPAQPPLALELVRSRDSEEILVDDHSRGGEYKLPCLNHHLSDAGCEAPNCPFDHDSEVSHEQLHELKEMALLIPCRFLNNDRPCPLKECHFGHTCPRGTKTTCVAYQRNNCPFVGLGMHS